jgi:hypothetical protein
MREVPVARSIAIFGILLAGCGEDDATAPPSADPARTCQTGGLSLTVGTGAEAFRALAAGDPLALVHGPQGGWHLEAAGLVEQTTGLVAITPSLRVPELDDLVLVEANPVYYALVGHDPSRCEGSFLDVRGPVQADQDLICALEGLTLVYEVTVSDLEAGTETTATVEVVAELGDLDAELCGS